MPDQKCMQEDIRPYKFFSELLFYILFIYIFFYFSEVFVVTFRLWWS
jgi:hypothetical protein